MLIDTLSAKQREIFRFASQKEDAIICDGAVRSGKTLSMSVAFILWAMAYFKNTNFAICGKTIQSAERNILRPLMQVDALHEVFTLKYLRGDRVLIITAEDYENRIYLFGGKDESSYTLIQGITLAGVLFDEVALMPKSFVDQAIARTLSIVHAKLWFNCNPESPHHWFYKEWIENPKNKSVKRLHFLMEDNPILGYAEIEKAKTMFSGVFYDRYILGRWVQAEGAIYKIFAENKAKYYTDKPEYDFIQVGLDFGGNKSAHSICATGLMNDMSKITALMAERYDAAGTSPEDLYCFVESFLHKVSDKYGAVSLIFADSAEQTLINGLKSRIGGVRGSLKKPIIDRIRCTTALMASGRFFITRDCTPLVEAFELALYNNKSLTDERLDDGSTPIDDLDSFEYSFEKYLKQLSY